MDQVKIGKFIAKLRKEKKMTQQELAEKLHVTDRAVSNWENGRRMPDVSLFKPLCATLGITINELMSGEKILPQKMVPRSNEILLDTLKEKEKIQKKWKKSIWLLILILILILCCIFFIYKGMHPNIDLYSLNFTYLDEPNTVSKAFRFQDRDVYYYGVENTFLCNQKQDCFDLEKSLKYKQSSFSKIQDYLEFQNGINLTSAMLGDGGTTIYQNENYAVIFCNTLEGNRDIYFGKSEMIDALDGEYCGHEKSSLKKFVRTYHVENIKESDQYEIEVTLVNNKNEQAIIKLSNRLQFMVGKTYEFTFYTFENFEDTIVNIFSKSIYVNHHETEKIGEEQINEPIVVNEKSISESGLENVTVSIQEGSLSRTGVKILIHDVSGENYSYGTWYRIDKMVNGTWQQLSVVLKENYGWNDIANHVDKMGNLILDIDWEWLYGTLDNGYYRIVKYALSDSLEKKYFSVKFEIK